MADSDLDPKAFLQTVRDLSDKRKKEDAERYEKLEADIMQDRNARLARRMERERSLSPEKTPRSPRSYRSSEDRQTPARDTPPPAAATPASPIREPLRNDSVRSRPTTPLAGSGTSTPLERPSSPNKASPSAAMPSRANTLSWQQRRPNSGIRSRPLSLLSNESSAIRPSSSTSQEPISEAQETCRHDIAKSLGAKDPSWFKQTADRGVGSAAYRRNRDEELETEGEMPKRQLPGLMKGISFDEPRDSTSRTESVRSDPPSRFGSVRDSVGSTARTSDVMSGYGSATEKRPMSSSSREHAAPGAERVISPEMDQSAFARTTPSLQKRMSVDRPPSPTKGMGGFVQSAMLKRSDSVNKRWSAQPGAGLSRQDSTVSIRSGVGSIRDGLPGSRSMPKLDTAELEDAGSRPTSSHGQMGNLTLQEPDQKERSGKTTSSLHSRAKSMASLREAPEQDPNLQATFSPPLSPSKRWSPTKASWLESALARPESPKPSLTQPTQPSWMTDLNKAKQQRNSAETTPSQGTGDFEVATASTASVKSFQPVAVSGPAQGSSNKALSTNSRPMEAFASSTPPATKSKPVGLAISSSPMPSESIKRTSRYEQPPVEPTRPKQGVQAEPRSITPPPAPAETPVSVKSSFVPSAVASTKEKPTTPPKKDFRSALKSRQGPLDGPDKQEPEFKNVFGKLRKTQTEKYVAPDLLKNNILRGKAGLATTDGPQKTERRDELKESLLDKKEEIKAKGAQEEPKKIAPVPKYPETPEALLRKKQLGRTDSTSSLDKPRRDITPEALSRHRTMKSKPAPATPEKPRFESSRPLSVSEKSKPLDQKPVGISAKSRTQGEKPLSISAMAAENRVGEPKAEPEQVKTSEPVASSKFANRFNPALAGILARGPPPTTGNPSTPSSSRPYDHAKAAAVASSDADSGKQLTHMTKSRAKGPKRRKPNARDVQDDSPAQPAQIQQPKRPISQTLSSGSVHMPLQPPPKSAAVRAVSMTMSKTPEKEKPRTPTKSASLSLKNTPTPQIKLSPSSQPKSHSFPEPASTPRKASIPTRQATAGPLTSSPRVSAALVNAGGRMASRGNASFSEKADDDKENTNGVSSVKSAAIQWGQSPQSKSTQQRGMPVKLPSKEDEEAAMKSAGLLSSSPRRYNGQSLGLGISAEKSDSQKSSSYPISPPSSAGFPPRPAKSSRVVSSSLGGTSSTNDTRGTFDPQTTHAGRLLAKHFGSVPSSNTPLDIDTHSVLSARPTDTDGIKTLRKTIQEISGDGKLMPLPAQEEHVLFEESMYVCTHVYGSSSGARSTEVYLWAGACVSESAIEDAQLFAKKVAKDAATGPRSSINLQVIRQAREPTGFFQALGGIVIVRRGSRADAATKPYMLCGRPHVGHVAFDEVDMSLGSLCSGLPFIVVKPITLQNNKVFLWKGSGCGPETVGSARLISMDLDTSGDIVEMDEDGETHDFLELLSSDKASAKARAGKTPHRPIDKSSPRLFRIDAIAPRRSSSSLFWPTSLLARRPSWSSASRPTSSASNKSANGNLSSPDLNNASAAKMSATELAPFSQSDIEPENVYILDCMHTLYVLPGPLLSGSTRSDQCFTQALLFCSEYAILSASEEDRPAVPAAKVVLGNMPRDARMVFRYWDSRRGLWGTGGMMAGRAADGEESVEVAVSEAIRICCREG